MKRVQEKSFSHPSERPPQVKSGKAAIVAPARKIPRLSFGPERKLTAYAGIVLFQALFQELKLLRALRQCCAHPGRSAIFGLPRLLLLLIVHLLLGFRRLRDLDFYRDDPLVGRVVGLRRLPDVATLSRGLNSCDQKVVTNLRGDRSAHRGGIRRGVGLVRQEQGSRSRAPCVPAPLPAHRQPLPARCRWSLPRRVIGPAAVGGGVARRRDSA